MPPNPKASLDSTDNIYKQILSLALPLILANFVQQIYSLTDVFFLGRYQNSNALAAAGASIQVSWMVIYLFVGISVGAGIVTAQSYGAKDRERLHRASHTTISASLISGVIITTIGILITPALLRLINVPDEVFPEAYTYLRIHYLSMFPFIIYSMGSAILRGVGDTKTSMYALTLSLLVKFILVLIFVRFMGKGVTYAASTTICAQITAAGVVIMRLLRSKEGIKLYPAKLKIHFPTLKKIVKIGVPTGFQALAQYLTAIYFHSQVNVFGPNVMAGSVTYTRVEGFLFVPIEGFSMAASTITGHYIGAKKPEKVNLVMKKTSFMSVGVALFFSFLIISFGPWILSLFNPTNPIAVKVGYLFLLSIIPFYFLYSLTQNFGAVIRGTGEAKAPLIITLIFACGIRVLWITLLQDNLNLLCISNPIAWVLTVIFYLIYYRKGNWLKKHQNTN
ncbi:MAG: MATE family efflux transporter [Deltaproteobacteria bacterium]|jgi:putative MATE family efflux protein|nr:MATE family efflux transporter [Deltaproteobacteria bacterium]